MRAMKDQQTRGMRPTIATKHDSDVDKRLQRKPESSITPSSTSSSKLQDRHFTDAIARLTAAEYKVCWCHQIDVHGDS